MGSSQLAPRCRACGQPMKLLDEEKQRWYCYKDDEVYYAKEQRWGEHEAVVPVVQKPPAPPVGESDVWVPILWLVGIIFLGFISWILGLLGLTGATIYVYYNAKKFGIGGAGYAVITLVLAIIGLPVYAYELHKLRKEQQMGRIGTLVQQTAPTTPSVAQQASAPTKFCRECGAKIARDSAYCEECGAKLI